MSKFAFLGSAIEDVDYDQMAEAEEVLRSQMGEAIPPTLIGEWPSASDGLPDFFDEVLGG